MRLAVFVELQTMFQVPQELVGLSQPAVFGAGEISFVLQTRQGQHGPAVTDPGLRAAVQTLQALDQELDVADAAALQLHVDSAWLGRPVGLKFFLTSRELFIQALAGCGKLFDSGKVQAGGVDPGLDEIQQRASGGTMARGHARLDQHLQFPVARALLVVVLSAFDRQADLAQASVGAQAQVHAVTHPFGGIGRKKPGELIRRALEKFLVGYARRPGSLSVGRIQKHQVDIGAVVEFLRAHLAQGDHGKMGFFGAGSSNRGWPYCATRS